MKKSYVFPKDFLWGAATASYQVEGAHDADGRGMSIWDDFSHSPGRVAMDHNGDVSVDQYHRYKEDVELMSRLGLKAYRFSISWPRIFPEGDGAFNAKGADYYDRLIDAMSARGIEPWVTFFHWDLPLSLQKRFGGWQSKDTAKLFADYVGAMTARISDRVTNFFTINEFMCFTDSGYVVGEGEAVFPPSVRVGRKGLNQVRHNALLGHGLAVQAIRANAVGKANVGLAENSAVCVPVIETEAHIRAARKAMREVNGHFLTAVLEGAYPESYRQSQGADMPDFTDEEMRIIGSPLDFVGLNAYAPCYVRASDTAAGYELVSHPESYPRMDMPWLFIGPQITYWAPRHMKEIWGVDAVYITENGCACQDKMTVRGEVLDTDRVLYLRNHFIAAHRAVDEGWPLKGYFVWSLLDNFEWACGYGKRFGIVYVNYQTLERTPKLSAEFYREVIRAGAVV